MSVLADSIDVTCPKALPIVDQQIARCLQELSESNPDFWAFSSNSRNGDDRAYFQYPAMMIPAMQRELLRIITELVPDARRVLDVFAGSGTVLSEAMRIGLSATVQDVNPLAILLCRVRTGPFLLEELRERGEQVYNTACSDRTASVEADFHGLRKWFGEENILQLSRLRRAIRSVDALWARRFFWVALAETVRLTTYSRTSTYKLHIRVPTERATVPLALTVFHSLVDRNLKWHREFAAALEDAGHLDGGHYSPALECRLRDSRLPVDGVHDLLITSPPYGDNRTTVPYGQSSYLPLQWIDLHDIEESLNTDILRSTYEIDRRSLGGELQRGDPKEINNELLQRSASLRWVVDELSDQPRDRTQRILFFIKDLELALNQVVPALRLNAYLILTVGNRRVGGVEVPLDRILSELLANLGVKSVAEASRRIPSKRMATRNAIAATMRNERLLIYRKAQ